MRNELYDDLMRYEAMSGISDYTDQDDPGREDRDRQAFGNEYGLVRFPDGKEYLSYARMVRFLADICGHSYEESLDAVVEHIRSLPHGYRDDLDVEGDARAIRNSGENIIEALFNLKVSRLIEGDDERALDYSWQVTRAVIAMKRPPRLAPPST